MSIGINSVAACGSSTPDHIKSDTEAAEQRHRQLSPRPATQNRFIRDRRPDGAARQLQFFERI
jgi:hypothetical protein